MVTKSFNEDGITLGGVPAKKISNNSLQEFVAKKLFYSIGINKIYVY